MIIGLKELKDRLAKDRVNGLLADATDIGSRMFHEDVLRRTPRDSGKLAESIKLRPVKIRGITVTATIETRKFYAQWVERGTGIYGPHNHPIVPTTPGGLLVFFWKKKGVWMFVPSVRGQPPQWMFRDAFNQMQTPVLLTYDAFINRL